MGSRPITVLHVDDSQQFTNLVREFLQTQHDDISVITCLSGEEALERLDKVSAALSRADELLDYLGELADGGGRRVESEPVDLREVAAVAWSSVETDEATLCVEESMVFIADRQGVLMILENLFKNAVEHAGPNVRVSIDTTDDGFAVEGDGPGIPESDRAQIFGMGFSSRPSGTGVGLAICKQRADANGWSIQVTEGATGGARFVISGVTPA